MSKTINALLAIVTILVSAFFAVHQPSGLSNPSAQQEQEESNVVDLKKVPTDVQETIKAAVGDNKIESVGFERENGTTVYEAVWKTNGKFKEIAVLADGSVVEHEEEIGLDTAPHSVQAVASERFPKGTKITVEKKMVVVYELEAMIDGRERSIIVSPAGMEIEIEVEAFDNDDEDQENDEDENGDDEDDK